MDYEPLPLDRVTTFDAEADVVVVGLGGAGACATWEAARAGASVLAVERASGGGGLTSNSGGILYLGGGTSLQTACGFEDSPEEMFKYLMAACGPGPDEDLVRVYCEESVEHFDWLLARGLPVEPRFFPDAHEPPDADCLIYTGSEEAWPFNEIARPAPRGHCGAIKGSKGALLMQVLLRAVDECGATVVTEARAQRLLVASDGRVAGLEIQVAGQRRHIRAHRGVILTAGGFAANESMLAQYAPKLLEVPYRLTTDGDDGAGIQMGLSVGGAALHMDAGDISLPLFPPVGFKRGLLVNRAGQRFINEDAYFGRLGEIALLHQEGRVFLIMDADVYEKPVNVQPVLAGAGETVPELEREMGLPEGALQATVEVYNRHAQDGSDPLFHKNTKWVKPLTSPPYGAYDLSVDKVLWAAFTLGGLRIDPTGAVLRPSGEAVPGLFAAGRTTSGIAKQGYSSGLSVGDATFFGRRAGRAAAAG